MKKIGLIALDMDGTLFNSRSEISEKDKATLCRATKEGIAVAVATGRAYKELPFKLLAEVGIRYAITGNGSGLYRIKDGKCIFSDCLDTDVLCSILEELEKLDVYYDIYVEGKIYCPQSVLHNVRLMDMSETLHDHIFRTRIVVENLREFIRTSGKAAEKATVNFALLPDGTLRGHKETAEILDRYPQVEYLCGGFHNWEFTRAGVTKGTGLKLLAQKLGVPMEETLACGDSGNDLAMLEAAGLSVAMENATEEVKAAADFITRSNDENGVAYAVEKFALGLV